MEIYVKGVKFKLDFSFVLVIAFALLYGYKNSLLIILYSVLHELGHLTALLAFEVEIREIKLSFFGFGIKFDGLLSLPKEALMLLFGPMVNLVLFLLFRDSINLMLFVLNMLPIFPLDGGRLLLLFFTKTGKYISLTFLLLLTAVSTVLCFKYGSFPLLLISVYLFLFNMRLL